MSGPLLSLQNVAVHFDTPQGRLRAVDGVDLELGHGRTLGIVGESGSGKSVLSRTIMGLWPSNAHLGTSSRIMLEGQDLLSLPEKQLRRIRGPEISMIFQDPMTSLNPVMTIGRQISEAPIRHLGKSKAEARDLTIELLTAVGIPQPEERIRAYPHQLSGGMRQRVAIAMALACQPKLLIADEPTTALDVTVQAEILDLLARQTRERQMALILITHDLGVVAGRTDDVAVMYAGRVVERGSTRQLFGDMRMPYTEALLKSIPRLDDPPHKVLNTVGGRPPNLVAPSAGCRFAPRCPYADAGCEAAEPSLEQAADPGHQFACFKPLNTRAVA
ncbi:ABC transporter ATP-binding protein [Minwuia sp.]|uniref:ABC transporter ATP-binding protein n=1 Tax=Minwuia sp. TaxID=2493630 RepID=UPI003A94C55F